MKHLYYISRPVNIEDYNNMVNAVNEIIDYLIKPQETVNLTWKWEFSNRKEVCKSEDIDVSIPRSFVIRKQDDLTSLLSVWLMPSYIVKEIEKNLSQGKCISLIISLTEQTLKENFYIGGSTSLEDSLEITQEQEEFIKELAKDKPKKKTFKDRLKKSKKK